MRYTEYWNSVIGDSRTAATAVAEFELEGGDRGSISEWLTAAEEMAHDVCADADEAQQFRDDIEEGGYHDRAVDELYEAAHA